MKIIYTQKRAREELRKKLILSFECLSLAFVMCVIGLLWSRRGLDELDNNYESAAISDSLVLDFIELEIPASAEPDLETEYIESNGEMSLFDKLFMEKQESVWTK